MGGSPAAVRGIRQSSEWSSRHARSVFFGLHHGRAKRQPVVKAPASFIPHFSSLPGCPTNGDHLYLRAENTAYLVSDVSAEQVDRWLRRNYQLLFEEELGGWWTDPTHWPASRTYRLFRNWFDVEVSSVVIDLAPGRIIREEM